MMRGWWSGGSDADNSYGASEGRSDGGLDGSGSDGGLDGSGSDGGSDAGSDGGSGNPMLDTLREQNAEMMGGWWSGGSDGGSGDGDSSDGGSYGGSDGASGSGDGSSGGSAGGSDDAWDDSSAGGLEDGSSGAWDGSEGSGDGFEEAWNGWSGGSGNEPLGALSTIAGPEERGGKGAGGSGEAQAQGQPRDSAMAPMQPSLGPPRDEPRVFGLDKFNGDNFAEWSFKMENIFDHYDLLEVMEGTEKRPKNDPEKSPWVRKSAQGYLLFGQALGSSQVRHIKPFQREPEKGPKAWAALKGVHTPATAAVAVVLEQQMAALRIEEDEAVEEGVQKFFDLLTRLEGADLNYSELQKKTKLLALLPQSWSSLIINLNRDLPRLSLEDVKRAILQEDFRRRELAIADGAGAASIGHGYGRGRGRGRGGGRFGGSNINGGRGSSGYGNDNKNNGRGRGRFDGECHFCHKSGHMWRDCYKLPDGWTPAQGQEGRGAGGGRGRGRGGRGGRGGGAASMKSAGNESESRDDRFPGQFFFVSKQAPAGPEKDEGFEEPAAVGKVTLHSLDYWVIDSGATYSMTPRADLLTELEPSPVKHVTSALGQRAEVKGMGKAMFKGADGKMVGLKNCVKGPEEESVGEEERRRFHSLVGSLMYAALNTRPDVAFATGQLARVVQCPNEEQVAAGMRVAKYLGQTATVGLQYSAAAQRRQKGADGVEPVRLFLTAFSDASFASEPEDMTSVGGFICCVGGGPTAWESKKQVDQALSSVESEYMALFRAVREIVWQRRLLAELGEEQQGPTPLYCDSQGAIALAKNPVLHGLTKHMRVKWHWTRSMVAVGEVELHYVKTTGQPADMMTKRLVEQQHWNRRPAEPIVRRADEPPSRRAAEPPSRHPAESTTRRADASTTHRLPDDAAQQPSRPTAEPPSSRAARQPSRPAAEPPDSRAAKPSCSLVATAPTGAPRPYLLGLCDRADGLSLFDLTSGASPAPPATADSAVRSQWATRDAAARLAVRCHLPTTKRAHFSQYKSAQTLYDAVVARYSFPAIAALSRLMLPYLFPDLPAFPTVTDLITHLRTTDTRYRAALPADQGPLPLSLPHHTHR
ncbi:unnamed protein product [Closterium sp. NIES-54]